MISAGNAEAFQRPGGTGRACRGSGGPCRSVCRKGRLDGLNIQMFPVSEKPGGMFQPKREKQECFNCFKLRFMLFLSSPMLYNLPGTLPESSAGLVGFSPGDFAEILTIYSHTIHKKGAFREREERKFQFWHEICYIICRSEFAETGRISRIKGDLWRYDYE